MPVNTLALDRLYNLTVEKYDRACTNSSGRNKGGKTDLRKVVLLSYARSKLENYTEDDAHIYDFLETMRGEDHEKEETFTELLPATNQTQSYVNMHTNNVNSPSKDSNTVTQQESSSPSATVLQSVVSNSDQHTSTYCQYTSPVCCSVNTHQIMSSEPYPHLGSVNGEMQLVEESEAPQYVECEEVVVTDENNDVTNKANDDDDEEEYIDVISLEPAPKPKKRSLPTPVAKATETTPCKKPKISVPDCKKFTVLSIINKTEEELPQKSLEEISEIEKRLGFPAADFTTFTTPVTTVTHTNYGQSVTYNCASLTTSSPKSTQVTQVTGSYSYAQSHTIPWQYLLNKEKSVSLD